MMLYLRNRALPLLMILENSKSHYTPGMSNFNTEEGTTDELETFQLEYLDF